MIEISFENSNLKSNLEDPKYLKRILKDKKLIYQTMIRMRDVYSVQSMADLRLNQKLRLHALTDDLAGLYSLDIPNKFYGMRIIFVPLNGDDLGATLVDTLPPNPKLYSVTKIHILDWCDDHKKPDKDNLKKIFQQFRNK